MGYLLGSALGTKAFLSSVGRARRSTTGPTFQFPLIAKWTSSVILSEDQCTSANPAPTHRSDVQLSCNHSENSFSSHLKIFSPACFSECFFYVFDVYQMLGGRASAEQLFQFSLFLCLHMNSLSVNIAFINHYPREFVDLYFSNLTVDIERDSFGWNNAVSGKFGRLIFPTQNKPTPLQINNPTQQIEILHSIHMQA